MTEPPSWDPYPLRCLECRYRWQGWLPTGVAVPVFVAVLQTITCPKCGVGFTRVAPDLTPEPE